MKKLLLSLSAMVLGLGSAAFASPAMEKAFIDTYKKAFETKDEATLKGLLYTEGSDPGATEFYTMMLTGELEGKIASIELRDLNDQDKTKANAVMPMPDGGNAKLVLNPTKKLVLKIETNGPNGNSSSTSESFVAEHNGKYVIPVPGPVK